jgi:DNA-binding MarR family transcriptional regulator
MVIFTTGAEMATQSTPIGIPRLAAASVGNDVGLLLAKLHASGSALNNRVLASLGLRERSFSILTLASSGLEPTQRELADFLSLDPSQVVALVDSLERSGLVERTARKQDRRAKIITATDQGEAVQAQARVLLEASERDLLVWLSDSEVSQLRALLKKALWRVGSDEPPQATGIEANSAGA